jgi:hypothetical protein
MGAGIVIVGGPPASGKTALATRIASEFGVQIHCRAPVEVLHERYRARLDERHPGHADAERIEDAALVVDPDRYLLPLPDPLVVVDTTSSEPEVVEIVLAAVRVHLGVGAV